MTNLNAWAWISVAALAVVMGLLLFVTAGTVRYPEGWIYLAVFIGTSALITRDIMVHDPALLERRMRGGPMAEKRPAQKRIMLGTSIGFIALLIVPALDFRFGWSTVPLLAVAAGDILIVIGFYLISRVYHVNTFMSATIELAEDQKVVTTGPYAVVRHPMYASALLYLLGTPLALASYWGLTAFAAMAPFLVLRLYDEERYLAENLPGYTEYQKRVRYRLAPFVW